MENKNFKAIVITLSDQMQKIENIKSILIKSSDYNILVMEDFMPTIGEVKEGIVEIISQEGKVKYENVNGYYIINRNQFKLIIRGE